MFLRNYDNMLVLSQFDISYADNAPCSDICYGRYIGVANSWGDGSCNVKYTDGSVSGYKLGQAYYQAYLAPMLESTICLGDGTKDVTYDDYKLSGNVVDNRKLTSVSISTVYDPDTHKFKRTALFSYTNDGDTPITISEWGLFNNYNSTTSLKESLFSHSSNVQALLYREVLDEPIVIEPRTSATLNFSIEIPMPNHP